MAVCPSLASVHRPDPPPLGRLGVGIQTPFQRAVALAGPGVLESRAAAGHRGAGARVETARRNRTRGAGFWLAFGAGLLSSLGNVAYYQALAAGGKAAAVTPLTALYPLVTIGLALLFLRERLNAIQAAGAGLSLAAIYCFNGGAGSAWLTPWLAVALIPIALWGVGALLQKLSTNQASVEFSTAAFLLGELPVSLVTPLFVPMNWALSGTTWGLLLLLGLLFALGNLTLIYAYGRGGKAAIVTPLASLYSLVTIPLAVASSASASPAGKGWASPWPWWPRWRWRGKRSQ